MSPTRQDRIEMLMALPEEERYIGYMSLVAREAAEMKPVVIMCACEGWVTCAHPWPSVLSGPQLLGIDLVKVGP